jgi:hypothetical protein
MKVIQQTNKCIKEEFYYFCLIAIAYQLDLKKTTMRTDFFFFFLNRSFSAAEGHRRFYFLEEPFL